MCIRDRYETDQRHYAHVDCPGHADYVKNMITGCLLYTSNHLDAERFRDAEVTVVTRNGADPLDSRILCPGFAAEGAEVEASRDGIAHELSLIHI